MSRRGDTRAARGMLVTGFVRYGRACAGFRRVGLHPEYRYGPDGHHGAGGQNLTSGPPETHQVEGVIDVACRDLLRGHRS
jgi:hypothetical protein